MNELRIQTFAFGPTYRACNTPWVSQWATEQTWPPSLCQSFYQRVLECRPVHKGQTSTDCLNEPRYCWSVFHLPRCQRRHVLFECTWLIDLFAHLPKTAPSFNGALVVYSFCQKTKRTEFDSSGSAASLREMTCCMCPRTFLRQSKMPLPSSEYRLKMKSVV